MLADSQVEAVVIATPPPTHFSIATTCLQHGKHVLVEKPCALKFIQVHTLRLLAMKNEKVFMAGPYRWRESGEQSQPGWLPPSVTFLLIRP
ncbi:MAG: Gfo/Idh/MocA family oxidoreductase [Clostridia bacterium]|nr:MAG: Gfo/Idh/MocA family oxidoreductase [Clostridia bacterium]